MANYFDTFEKISFWTPEIQKVNFELLLSFIKWFTMFMENFSIIWCNIIHEKKKFKAFMVCARGDVMRLTAMCMHCISIIVSRPKDFLFALSA